MQVINLPRFWLFNAVLAILTTAFIFMHIDRAIERQVEYSIQQFMTSQVEPCFKEYMLEANIDGHISKNIQIAFDAYAQEVEKSVPLVNRLTLLLIELRATERDIQAYQINWLDNSTIQRASFDIQLSLSLWPFILLFIMLYVAFSVFEQRIGIWLAKPKSNSLPSGLEYSPLAPYEEEPISLSMQLNCSDYSVVINQQSVSLTKTQFLYLLWYAQKRKEGINEGWILNPHADNPCQQGAQELLQLMLLHNGHQRAINELTKYGLRAKTLDQNRNKIKDVYSSTQVCDKAKIVLFDSLRDAKTGRYMHRLAFSADVVIII